MIDSACQLWPQKKCNTKQSQVNRKDVIWWLKKGILWMCRYIPGIMKNFIVVNGLIENECHCEPETIIEQKEIWTLRFYWSLYTVLLLKTQQCKRKEKHKQKTPPPKVKQRKPRRPWYTSTRPYKPSSSSWSNISWFDLLSTCKITRHVYILNWLSHANSLILMGKRKVKKRYINPPPPAS